MLVSAQWTLAQDSKFEKFGKVKSSKITEASGIACSLVNPKNLWIHNDSGDNSEIYLVNRQGDLLIELEIRKQENRDWEDLCSFERNGENFIVVAETGDNLHRHKKYRLIFIKEPKFKLKDGKTLKEKTDASQVIEFQYPNGSNDCEAIAYSKSLDSIILITKSSSGQRSKKPAIFAVKIPESDKKKVKQTATLISKKTDLVVTAMDISSDDRVAVVRTYFFARLFFRKSEQTWAESFADLEKSVLLATPVQKQAEATCFSSDSKQLMMISEGKNQRLWGVDISSELSTSGTPKK